jgi:MFS family permease
MIVFVFVNFFAVKILDTLGVRFGALIGCVLTTVGISLQCLINENIIWAVLGHMIIALAWPFLWNATALVTSNMFKKEIEQKIATLIGTSVNATGAFLGFLIPTLLIDS